MKSLASLPIAQTRFKTVFFVAFILLAISVPTMAQTKWPTITQTNKPWTRWWWLGSEVNQKDLTTVMQDYQKAGLGGLEITPIYGVTGHDAKWIPFLSKEWMGVFDHTLAEGKRLDLGIDLANATGWPFGGPWVGEEDASKNMQFTRYQLKAGERLKEKVVLQQEPLVRTENYKPRDITEIKQPLSANSNMQALSLDQVRFKIWLPLQRLMAYADGGGSLDLTSKVDKEGNLDWVAPAGNWTLIGLFMGQHGKQVERAAPGGEGNVIDHFSKTALDHYLSKFDQAFKGHDISYLRGFFNDSYEVDDARGQSNYTPQLLEEFKRRRGYDLAQELIALTKKEKTERDLRVLCDYRMTIDELILEQFTGEWKKWAVGKKKIVRNQSHGSPANTLDLYGVVDIPEIEGTELLRIKFASSTSHVMGKKLTSAESATWLNEHFVSTLSDVKKALDTYFIGGVNHIVYHGTSYSPPADVWPGYLFYAAVEFTQENPFWQQFPALNHYVARTQSLLQDSKPDNDVLLYFPIYDKYQIAGRDFLWHFDGMKPEFNGTAFEIAGSTMQEKGYSFDYISDRQIAQLKANGKQILAAGTQYQTVVLPGVAFMQLESMKKLWDLAANGASVLAYHQLPKDIPGLGNYTANKAAYDQLISQLHFESTSHPEVKKAILGKGVFYLSDNLEAMLSLAAIRKESMVSSGLEFIRTRRGSGNLYFIANRTGKSIEGWYPVNSNLQNTVCFNPMNDALGKANTRKTSNGSWEVYLQLAKDESILLQTSKEPLSIGNYPYFQKSGEAIAINSKWTLTFLKGGPVLPAPKQLSSLQEWTSIDTSYQYFSGTASYTTSFKKPSGTAKQYLLDLGQVRESADIILNGVKLASLIGPVFQLPIDASLLKEENQLEIQVANSMANRIIDLEKRKVVWKKFNNTNYPARLAQNRNANGLFDASNWLPKASGLSGTVQLIPIQSFNPSKP